MDLVSQLTGVKPSEIIFASGASKSTLWCQIVADVLGLPVHVPKVKEATALGGAILAGIGVGIYEDVETAAKRIVKIENTYHPNEENHAIYNHLYTNWREIYSAQLSLSDRKLTKHMWNAPGV